MQALQVHAMLANGMGGIDWQGLGLACAYHGVHDVDMLIHRLVQIKTHRTERAA